MVRISDTAIIESYIQNSHAVWVHIIKYIHFTCLIIFVWNRLVMSPVFTFQYASVQHHARSESELVPPEVDINSACDWLWIYVTGVIASAFHTSPVRMAPHQLPSSTQQLANTLVICNAEDNKVRSPAAKLEWYSWRIQNAEIKECIQCAWEYQIIENQVKITCILCSIDLGNLIHVCKWSSAKIQLYQFYHASCKKQANRSSSGFQHRYQNSELMNCTSSNPNQTGARKSGWQTAAPHFCSATSAFAFNGCFLFPPGP